ncbi:calcium/sodium antiporter [Candidatus Woesearchaeota archaeon]|nr:calcium/sodium antiporter [Candidatus Woesearchaeota archaeon]
MLEILFVSLMIVVSLFVLVKGANYLVDGSADFARFLRISPILVGLTIVAFGTSLPEFIVSLFSVLAGNADISIGNIIGSNIANIALVIGICAIITTLKVKSKTLMHEYPFMIISSFLLLILATDWFIFGKNEFMLGRIDGVILLTIFVFFMYYVFNSMKKSRKDTKKEFSEEFQHKNPTWKNILMIVGGIIALMVGGKLFIIYASELSLLAGLSDSFIGLLIAALGTSLPELATSGIAAWKKQGDIAIGNIVGSNIFNILFVLGTISLIKPITVNPLLLQIDAMIMLFVMGLFLVFSTYGKKIIRKEGIILVLIYALYVASLIWRG